VARFRTAAIGPTSLEAPLGEGDDSSVAEIVRDETANTPYEQLEEKTNASMLRGLVATLDPREAGILRFRFGLDGHRERTLDEVGRKFGVTRERIRQLQNLALRTLRAQIEKLETVQVAA